LLVVTKVAEAKTAEGRMEAAGMEATMTRVIKADQTKRPGTMKDRKEIWAVIDMFVNLIAWTGTSATG
jgi:hypothetical protein